MPKNNRGADQMNRKHRPPYPETFPQTFGIYDLNQFLSGLSLFQNPVLEFENESYVTIRSRGRSAKYFFSDQGGEMIKKYLKGTR